MLKELIEFGFKVELVLADSLYIEFGLKVELVLADSLYGEASSFIRTLDELKLPWIVAIRRNHGVWMPSHESVRANKWHQFQKIFSNQTYQTRYIR
ncbi:transposase [Cyanobacteria bacterium FACHB-472]|nr:transposase [Cyanobacteria bacterium FACHB-472]